MRVTPESWLRELELMADLMDSNPENEMADAIRELLDPSATLQVRVQPRSQPGAAIAMALSRTSTNRELHELARVIATGGYTNGWNGERRECPPVFSTTGTTTCRATRGETTLTYGWIRRGAMVYLQSLDAASFE